MSSKFGDGGEVLVQKANDLACGEAHARFLINLKGASLLEGCSFVRPQSTHRQAVRAPRFAFPYYRARLRRRSELA